MFGHAFKVFHDALNSAQYLSFDASVFKELNVSIMKDEGRSVHRADTKEKRSKYAGYLRALCWGLADG